MAVQIKSSIASHDGSWDMGFHQHTDLEMSIVLTGNGILEVENETYAIQAGHIVFISSQIPHRFETTDSIRFAVIQVGKLVGEEKQLFNQIAEEGVGIFKLSFFALKEYDALFRSGLKMISQPLERKNDVVRAWLKLLMLFVFQHKHSVYEKPAVVTSAEFIRNNLHEEIHISQLANGAGQTEANFRKDFKETFGIYPKKYHQNCRLTEAKWILRSTDEPVERIGERVGFSSLHSFSAWFKKQEGLSPTNWRKDQIQL